MGLWGFGVGSDNLRFYTARRSPAFAIAGLTNIRIAGLVGFAIHFPRDEAGYARCARHRIGPMDVQRIRLAEGIWW